MRLEFKEYIKNIIRRLDAIKTDRHSDRICIMKHYTGFSMEEEDIINIMASLDFECDMYYYSFSDIDVQSPFCPFLGIIKEMYSKYYKDMGAAEFTKKVGMYKAIEYMFIQYLENGRFERKEDIISEEIKFEKKKILEAVYNMLKFISSEHKMVIVLKNIQCAHMSSVCFLNHILMSSCMENVLFIGTYNESFSIKMYMKDEWNSLLGAIKMRGLAIDCDDDIDEYEQEENFIPNKMIIEQQIEAIRDLILCLALNQAKYYLMIIQGAIEEENIEVPPKLKADIYGLLTLSELLLGEIKIAYVICRKYINLEYVKNNGDSLFEYYYMNALIRKESGQTDAAIRLIEQGREIALKNGNEWQKVRIDMLEIITVFSKNNNILVRDNSCVIAQEVLEEAKQYDQILHLTYAYVYGFDRDQSVNQYKTGDHLNIEQLPEFKEGLRLSKELGNTSLELLLWQRAAVNEAAGGSFDETVYYYNKCLDVMEGQDKKHKQAQIYNGMGYNLLVYEKYDVACEYFNDAVKIGIELGEAKYILDAIYNLAITAIIVGDYETTVNYSNITLKIISSLNLQRINVCNKSKIYGMAIFGYLMCDDIYNARLYFGVMETILSHILENDEQNYDSWEDDIYLYYVAKSMILMQEGKYEEALEAFEETNSVWCKIKANQGYILKRVVEQEMKLCDILGKTDKKEQIIPFFMAQSSTDNPEKYAETLTDLLLGEDNKKMKIPPISDDIIDEIYELINKKEMELEIEHKNKIINFFETWVDLLNNDVESIEELISNSMLLIKNVFDIDKLVYIKIVDGLPVIAYCDSDIELKKYQLKYIHSHFEENKRILNVSRFQKSYRRYEEMVSVFDRKDIVSMVAIPFVNNEEVTEIFFALNLARYNFTEKLRILTEEEADVLKTAFREFIEAENREKIKKQLEKNSVTDLLTGMYNRQGMKEQVQDYLLRAEERGSDVNCIILYLDLDNFKYCNDNFGHDTGDIVLVSFARMLETIVEKDGLCVRYGGDEFIIILQDKEMELAVKIADKIHANLRHNRGFVKVIEKYKNHEVEIPEKNRITCSIGIAEGRVSEYVDIYKILKCSDEALYQVKKSTKNGYKVWDSENP